MNPLQAAQFLLLTTQLELQQRMIGLIELELEVLQLQVEIDELERPAPRRWRVKNWIRAIVCNVIDTVSANCHREALENWPDLPKADMIMLSSYVSAP